MRVEVSGVEKDAREPPLTDFSAYEAVSLLDPIWGKLNCATRRCRGWRSEKEGGSEEWHGHGRENFFEGVSQRKTSRPSAPLVRG